MIARKELAPQALAIDEGTLYPDALLRRLGEAGAWGSHQPENGAADLRCAIQSIAAHRRPSRADERTQTIAAHVLGHDSGARQVRSARAAGRVATVTEATLGGKPPAPGVDLVARVRLRRLRLRWPLRGRALLARSRRRLGRAGRARPPPRCAATLAVHAAGGRKEEGADRVPCRPRHAPRVSSERPERSTRRTRGTDRNGTGRRRASSARIISMRCAGSGSSTSSRGRQQRASRRAAEGRRARRRRGATALRGAARRSRRPRRPQRHAELSALPVTSRRSPTASTSISDKPLAMTAAEARRLVDAGETCRRRARRDVQLPRQSAGAAGADSDRRRRDRHAAHFVHGRYLQDWLLKETDFSLAPRAGQGRQPRRRSATSARTGATWSQHVSGLRITQVLGDCTTVCRQREKPSRSPRRSPRARRTAVES